MRKGLLLQQLKVAQAHADDARTTIRLSEQAAAEKVVLLQGLYQTALQREQQLG